jgi:hypothetical protein
MGSQRTLAVLVLIAAHVPAALNDPFPPGYAMESFGTIVTAGGVAGRQPWEPACLLLDSARFGLAACGVDYFDDMDTFTQREIRQGAAGGWLRPAPFLSIKIAYTHFGALDMYFEQKGFLSAATPAIPFVHLSVELSGYRAGLVSDRGEREALATAGVSLWVPWSFASVFLSCRDVVLEDAGKPGFAPPTTIVVGLHTAAHRFGAHGVRLLIEPGEETRFGLYVGQELRLHPTLALAAGFAAEPLMFSLGLTFVLPVFSAQTALVHHPVLGWSRGLGLEYIAPRQDTLR